MLKQICRTLLCIQYFIYSCNASSTSSTEQTQPNKTLSSSGSAKPTPPTNIHTISSLFSVQRQSIQQYKQLKGRLYKAANPHARIWCGLHAKQCFNVRDCVCVCVCVCACQLSSNSRVFNTLVKPYVVGGVDSLFMRLASCNTTVTLELWRWELWRWETSCDGMWHEMWENWANNVNFRLVM